VGKNGVLDLVWCNGSTRRLLDHQYSMVPWFVAHGNEKTTKIQLCRIQKMACLAITGAMRSTPTAATEVLLDLTPLDLLIMAEARMAFYRLQILKQPAVPKSAAGLLSILKKCR